MFKKALSAALLLAATVIAGEPLPGQMSGPSEGEMMAAAIAPRTNSEAFAQGLPPLSPRHASKFVASSDVLYVPADRHIHSSL